MKKLVAISVLLASLTAAVFAQEDEGKWKVGFMGRFVTDMLFTTKATAKSESETTTSGGTLKSLSEFGNLTKGSIEFFGNHDKLPHQDNRILLSLSNSGEGYEAYADIAFDDWANGWGGVLDYLNKGSADWWLKGNAGVFNAQVGTAGYGGWVSQQATWNDWYGWNQLCRFGVWNADGFLVSDDFRTWSEWGSIFAVGVGLGDNYKLSLGYRLNPNWGRWAPDATDPWGSKSSVNGSFMLNGRLTDAIALDLFYAVKGNDPDTFALDNSLVEGTNPTDPPFSYKVPDGQWENIIGVFVGINAIENLGLSIGYTANFRVYEAGGYIAKSDLWTASSPTGYDERTKTVPVNFIAPFYSGIDIRLSYSGIDKIGITFNNNISLANVKGEKINLGTTAEPYPVKTDKINLGFGGTTLNEGISQDWFHWDTELKVSFSFIENLGLTLHLGDRIGVTTDKTEIPDVTRKNTTTVTDNEFRVSLFADYGIGAANVGIGLFFGLQSKESVSETTNTDFKQTVKNNVDTATFGIPIMFKVQF